MLQIVWIAFTVFTLVTLLRSSRALALHPYKWHTGLMATSYSMMVVAVTFRLSVQNGLTNYFLIVAMALGTVGLINYWVSGIGEMHE